MNTDLVPTKNLPFSGLIPHIIAGAPSHLTVTLTLLLVLADNIFRKDFKNAIAFLPPLAPSLIILSSKCSRCVFVPELEYPVKLNICSLHFFHTQINYPSIYYSLRLLYLYYFAITNLADNGDLEVTT